MGGVSPSPQPLSLRERGWGEGSKSFNRNDRLSIRALGGIDARDHRLAIHKDGARTALSFIASDLCTCEAQAIAEQIRKCFVWLGIEGMLDTVDGKGNLIVHAHSPT